MANFELINTITGVLPKRGTKKSAGYDLCSTLSWILQPGERHLFKTGVTCSMDDNEYLAIVPRSGLAIKHGITVLNTPGTVDADYYPNEIGVILYNSSDIEFEVGVGDRIAQAILGEYKTMEIDMIKNVERAGGFGSTGK